MFGVKIELEANQRDVIVVLFKIRIQSAVLTVGVQHWTMYRLHVDCIILTSTIVMKVETITQSKMKATESKTINQE